MSLRYEEIAEILKVIEASSCDELIVETGDVKLVVRRRGAGQATLANGGPAAEGSSSFRQNTIPTSLTAPATPLPAAKPTVAEPAGHQAVIRAPMIGTFYRAPSPDAAPFVEVGSEVRTGDPLCLIEVMKLFTTIHAEHSGQIVQIGAANGELVEYGRALFIIEAAT